jgi:Ca2+-binding RTX toxin-like protein
VKLLTALLLVLPLLAADATDDDGDLRCRGRVVTIRGTAADDVLTGTDGADVIHGLEGDDRIEGLGGNDIICGGTGSDEILGGDGRDRLYGNNGNDILSGGPGWDHLYGDRGRDTASGGGGIDTCDAEFPNGCESITYYVRIDGGSPSECTGTADLPYPGTGSARPCAWDHPFRALPPGGSPLLSGGDTLFVGAGEYEMGLGAPGAQGCDEDDPWGCRLAPMPSGNGTWRPTRLIGKGGPACAQPPQLWGSGGAHAVIDLSESSYVEIGCLEITDHSSCVEDHTGGLACHSEDRGPWAAIGLYAEDSRDVYLHDLSIHGLASAGVAAGRLTDWTVENVAISANGWVGWEGDIDGDDGNHGEIVLRRVTVTWNGCAETYPGEEPTGCWAQTAGGYGDGLGTGETGGTWIIEDSVFSFNTSDGLDLLYLQRSDGSLTIRGLTAEGNAGDAVKATGPTVIEDLTADAECGFFTGKPFTFDVDACRAGGSAVAFTLRPGNEATLTDSDVSGEGDCLMIAECSEGGGCTGAERIHVSDSIFTGGPEFGSGGDTTCLAWHGLPADPFRYSNVDAYDVKVDPCPPGVTCH